MIQYLKKKIMKPEPSDQDLGRMVPVSVYNFFSDSSHTFLFSNFTNLAWTQGLCTFYSKNRFPHYF